MKDERMNLTINRKIGTFSSFRTKFTWIGRAGKIVGYLGMAADLYSLGKDLSNGQLSASQKKYSAFKYLSPIATSAAVGSQFGGAWGAAAGAGVGLSFAGYEASKEVYQATVTPLINGIASYENSLRGFKGW